MPSLTNCWVKICNINIIIRCWSSAVIVKVIEFVEVARELEKEQEQNLLIKLSVQQYKVRNSA